MATVAIRNCKFIPALTEGTDLVEGDLLFRDGNIAEIAACGADFGTVDQEIDAHGMTAMPGLIDAHLHLSSTRDLIAEQCFVDDSMRPLEALEFAQVMLGFGYTTVRDCGEDKVFSVVSVRNAINRGMFAGPRILTCGLTLCPTEAGCTPDKDFGFLTPYNVDGSDSMRYFARRNFAKGVDFLKLYGSGSMMASGSNPGVPIMDDDEIAEAVKIAKQKGSYCAIHSHGGDAIYQAVSLGVATVEHASFIDDRSLDILANKDDHGIVPTLAITADLVEHTDPNTDYGRQVIAKVTKLIEKIKAHLGHAYERGDVMIGWGTDVTIGSYRREPGAEFRIRKEVYGWDNLEILKQATINSAKLCRIADETGSIKVGKCADVILVDGNPVEDLSIMYAGGAKHVFRAGVQYK
ncbi:MAG: amidohydrolase family protein [Clostridia bacterium]|nr:amidohydrolase family protein [Clostridia bacterium]